MTKLYFYLTLVLLMFFLPVGAQEREMHWENVTALHFAATNGTDKENALQQYLLFDGRVMNRNEALFEQYQTVMQEFSQISLSKEAPQMNKEIDEMIANTKQLIKEHPELADELNEQLKEVERMRGEYNSYAENDVTEYTYDPKEVLRKLTAIAVGRLPLLAIGTSVAVCLPSRRVNVTDPWSLMPSIV